MLVFTVPDLQMLYPVDDRMNFDLTEGGGSNGKLDCITCNLQPGARRTSIGLQLVTNCRFLGGMPVTVVARAVAEPTFRNLRFIDIGGKFSDFSFLNIAHEITTRSEPHRSCVSWVPPWKEKTRWCRS